MSSRRLHAVIYTRVSTAQQAAKNSSEAQRVELLALCEMRGWKVVEVINDEAQSGRRQSRPGLDRVRELVKRRAVDVVVTQRLDRVARSVQHAIAFTQELHAADVGLVVAGQAVDTTTVQGKVFFLITAVFAELEADLARERTRAGLDAARKRGVQLGRRQVAITPEQAARAYEKHGSYREAAKALDTSPATVRRRMKEGADVAA